MDRELLYYFFPVGDLTEALRIFEHCIPDLAKHYRVIAPDSPGQGRSEQADTLTYEVLLDSCLS